MSAEGERLARIETKLETVIENQAQSRERQHAHANEIQALMIQHKHLNEKVEKALEVEPRVAVIERWKEFWQTIFYGSKWVGGMMALAFTTSLVIGEKIAKYMGFIK
jgi:hypothetical protein